MTKRVLIIEDDPTLQQVFSMIVSARRHDVQVAANGLEAIEKLKNFTPDVILLDMLMPKMDGLTFARKTQPRETLPNTKIILLSNLSKPDKTGELRELGITQYYLKANITPSLLTKLVESD